MFRNLPSSSYYLLAANTAPLFGVLFWGWNLVDILFIYWSETAIIGFYSLFKIMLTGYEGTSLQKFFHFISKIFALVFFTVHFGGFMAGHALVLYAIAHEFLGYQVEPLDLLFTTRYALIMLFLSHGYSFVRNFLLRGEKDQEKAGDPFLQPYARIIIMHMTLILGMFLVLIFGQPLLLLLFFITLKTTLDLVAHLKERRKFAAK
jgi:hypothetical protein